MEHMNSQMLMQLHLKDLYFIHACMYTCHIHCDHYWIWPILLEKKTQTNLFLILFPKPKAPFLIMCQSLEERNVFSLIHQIAFSYDKQEETKMTGCYGTCPLSEQSSFFTDSISWTGSSLPENYWNILVVWIFP